MTDFKNRHVHTFRDGEARRDRKRGEAEIYDGSNGPRTYHYRVSPAEKRDFKLWASFVFDGRIKGQWPNYQVEGRS